MEEIVVDGVTLTVSDRSGAAAEPAAAEPGGPEHVRPAGPAGRWDVVVDAKS